MKDDITRFAFIETCLLWGGGLTARQLADTFGIARQNAQKVITQYRQCHPENIRRVGRKQVAGADFSPHYIRKNAEAFLDYLRGQAIISYYLSNADWGGLPFHDVDRLLRPQLRQNSVQKVLSALRTQQVVTIYYHAKSGAQERDLSPNQLIFANNRYHVRGYCHYSKAFLDFVLSRITHAEPSGIEWVSSYNDSAWNTYDELRFKPNEQLPTETQESLLHDFPVNEEGIFLVRCRRALGFYVKRELLAVDARYGISRWVIF
ncbi:transcriptional regulator [Nitrosococcus halophilus Nc 4]|uniref:Transcriptional regulator n=1 Tax=Nitrosococcus halophilus (strain Nc4) TaxID=472759 RepID=D5BYJ5_NITHN|nr:WYL domain-containing protein [Nitrosococcus halophilus]ADE15983.1 transcriptional regulator [Nitrosococcus halophilus Nc 4]